MSSRATFRSALWIWALSGTVLGAGAAGVWIHRQHSASLRPGVAAGLYCDSGIGAAKPHGRAAVTSPVAAAGAPSSIQTSWTPKINDRRPPGPAPEGMTWIPGGNFWMGSREDRMTDA